MSKQKSVKQLASEIEESLQRLIDFQSSKNQNELESYKKAFKSFETCLEDTINNTRQNVELLKEQGLTFDSLIEEGSLKGLIIAQNILNEMKELYM